MRFIYFLALFITPFYSFSISDTIPQQPVDSSEMNVFISDLDSMVNLWHIKKLSNQKLQYCAVDTTDSIVPSFPDSVYAERLKAIQEVIPLQYNDIVQRFIELYANRRRKQVSIMLGLADQYFPVFEKELDAANLPLELKYMPVIESALNPLAHSRAGATGIWQFMYATGKLYGLTINSFVDERKNPQLATKAAIKMLSELHNIYNDWLLVIAAYNCGPGNVNKAIRRSNGKTTFWEIYYYLPRETRGYVPAFIAANYIFHYANEHKIPKTPIEVPVTDTVLVKEKIHFKQISELLNIPVDEIEEFNAQYRRDIIPASSKKKYPLTLPSDILPNFLTLEDSIAHYKDSIFFASDYYRSSPLKRSTYSSRYSHRSNYHPDKNSKAVSYTVKPGDNLGFIADWFHTSIQNIKLWNGIYGTRIKAGQKLTIYVPTKRYSFYKRLNSMTFAQKQRTLGITATASTSSTTPKKHHSSKKDTKKYYYYKVRRGDNFWVIARKFPGVSNYDIMKWNHIKDERSLKPGQILKIKKVR
jgi:membrane-bound lytic murein transglycosylase D